MKVVAYLRVAEGPRGPRVEASTKPNHAPLTTGTGWKEKVLPTVAFALQLDVPDELINQAEQVIAELEIPKEQAQIAADVKVL